MSVATFELVLYPSVLFDLQGSDSLFLQACNFHLDPSATLKAQAKVYG